jgi:hypothetical protein
MKRAADSRDAEGLRAACMHEYAHLVVARQFGACGFVTVARIAGREHDAQRWHGRFQLFGELGDDEWRIVALAGTIAEWIDAQAAFDTASLLAALKRPGTLSPTDASLAHGYGADDVERCVRIVTMAWHEIEMQATERAASIEANHATLLGASP